ncbi:hypothetical protein HID58_001822 [Brassica napus]|uniref:RNase H type-1 domain-containing protein n=1 Tax=Brassica napus TaxID=3708 RepID=A0ABQ8EKG7_BRANA|nr:hypothetical protein HID58_001822 [Brassica napus]
MKELMVYTTLDATIVLLVLKEICYPQALLPSAVYLTSPLPPEDRAMAMQYISHSNETERRARILRVQQSIELEKSNPPAVLTKISHNLEKEKGHVFGYGVSESASGETRMVAHAVTAPAGERIHSSSEVQLSGESISPAPAPKRPAVFTIGASGSSQTGSSRGRRNGRNRPPAWVRHIRPAKNVQSKSTPKVFDTFTEEDAARILKIKLSLDKQDTDVWGFTKDGVYTTRSGYKMLSVNSNVLACEEVQVQPPTVQNIWTKPPLGSIKCNIGMAWSSLGPFTGASWITRDSCGRPIHHSRRAFCSSAYKRESDLKSLLWAIEAMGSLRVKKVIFEASSFEVRQSLLHPYHYMDLLPLIQRILALLHCFEVWSICYVSDQNNSVAQAIAESVVIGARSQSYVGSGGPSRCSHKLQTTQRR